MASRPSPRGPAPPSSPRSIPPLLKSSTMLSETPGNRCYVCGAKAKRTCELCRKSVCKKHFTKRKPTQGVEKAVRICEVCIEGQVRREGKNDLEQQKLKLIADMESAKVESLSLAKRIEESRCLKEKLLAQIQKTKRESQETDGKLQEKLKVVISEGDVVRKDIEGLQSSLDDSNAKERQLNEQTAGMEKELDELRKEAILLRDEKADLLRTLQDIDQKEKSSIPLLQLKTAACPACKKRLDDIYRPRRSITHESLTSSRSSFPKVSLPSRAPAAPSQEIPTSGRECGKGKDCSIM